MYTALSHKLRRKVTFIYSGKDTKPLVLGDMVQTGSASKIKGQSCLARGLGSMVLKAQLFQESGRKREWQFGLYIA